APRAAVALLLVGAGLLVGLVGTYRPAAQTEPVNPFSLSAPEVIGSAAGVSPEQFAKTAKAMEESQAQHRKLLGGDRTGTGADAGVPDPRTTPRPKPEREAAVALPAPDSTPLAPS